MVTGSGNISFQEHRQQLTRLERIDIWMHEHPTTTKVLKVVGLIAGVGLLISLPFTSPILGVGAVAVLSVTGGFLTIISSVALLALDLIVPPHHDMKTHVYKPGQCEGGKLYYEGDVPVLSLDSDDPFKAGRAHGYLCGEAISRLSKRFSLIQPRADRLPNTLAKIRESVPARYLREIEGLVEGYNQWAKEQYWWQAPRKLTVDDALLFHLMPDMLHFQPDLFEGSVPTASKREAAVACSAIVDRDPEKGFVFSRNMDWPSLGLAGGYSLVINRKYTNGLSNTVEVAVPGFIGTLTGMNHHGLSIAMNVCYGDTKEVRGMPAAFYNRACLEECRTVKEVQSFTESRSPLGPYHLTVVDQMQAKSIHFYQSQANTHVVRSWKEDNPLTTLNYCYSPEPNNTMHYSQERQERISHFFQHREGRPLEEVLSLPFVNNWITTHSIVMEPQNRRFRVAFDNAFAGKAPLHEVPTQNLFKREIRSRLILC